MTPGEDRVHRFAAGLVGIDPDAPTVEKRAAAFRRIQDDGFLPDPMTHEALMAVLGRPVGPLLAELAAKAEQAAWRAEVERFAAEFFAIPPGARAERWQALRLTCARHPALADRLDDLKPGLGVDPGQIAFTKPSTRRVLDDLLALFPLRARERAVRARECLARARSDPSMTDVDRARAANDLKIRHPAVARLSDGYLARLLAPRRSNRAVRFKARASIAVRTQINRRSAVAGARQSPGLPALVLVVIVAGALRSLTTSPGRAARPSPSIGSDRIDLSTIPVVKAQPRPPTPASVAQLREELKGPIRREIEAVGATVDAPTLDRIAAALPVDRLPNVGGLAMIRLLGLWDGRHQAAFEPRLRAALQASGLGLDDSKLDQVVRNSLPRPARPGNP